MNKFLVAGTETRVIENTTIDFAPLAHEIISKLYVKKGQCVRFDHAFDRGCVHVKLVPVVDSPITMDTKLTDYGKLEFSTIKFLENFAKIGGTTHPAGLTLRNKSISEQIDVDGKPAFYLQIDSACFS